MLSVDRCSAISASMAMQCVRDIECVVGLFTAHSMLWPLWALLGAWDHGVL